MNQIATVSEGDRRLVIALKSEGILLKFEPEDFKGATKNGGVAVICADGDIDAPNWHSNLTHRPHCLRPFGGTLFLAPSFRGYDSDFEKCFADGLRTNLRLGMIAKDTQRVYLYVHAPCGVASHYNYGIREQLTLAAEAREFLLKNSFFVREKIFIFFHVKKTNPEGQLEQNTYRIAL